jgi:hypothetical protein
LMACLALASSGFAPASSSAVLARMRANMSETRGRIPPNAGEWSRGGTS